MLKPTPTSAALIAWLATRPGCSANRRQIWRGLDVNYRKLLSGIAVARAHGYVDVVDGQVTLTTKALDELDGGTATMTDEERARWARLTAQRVPTGPIESPLPPGGMAA